jgi:hypothetical protein
VAGDNYNDECRDFSASPYIIRVTKYTRVRWAEPVVHVEENRPSYRVAIGKPDRKRPLGIPKLR